MGNTPKQCRLGLFQDSDFAGDLEDSKSTSGGTLSIFGSHTRSFLNRVNDRLRKMLDHSSKDAMQDIDKRSMIWGMFMSSTLEASVFTGKNYSDNLHSFRNAGKDLTLKQMCLKSAGKILHGNIHLWSMMKKSQVSRMQRFMYSQILCYVLER